MLSWIPCRCYSPKAYFHFRISITVFATVTPTAIRRTATIAAATAATAAHDGRVIIILIVGAVGSSGTTLHPCRRCRMLWYGWKCYRWCHLLFSSLKLQLTQCRTFWGEEKRLIVRTVAKRCCTKPWFLFLASFECLYVCYCGCCVSFMYKLEGRFHTK